MKHNNNEEEYIYYQGKLKYEKTFFMDSLVESTILTSITGALAYGNFYVASSVFKYILRTYEESGSNVSDFWQMLNAILYSIGSGLIGFKFIIPVGFRTVESIESTALHFQSLHQTKEKIKQLKR